MTLIDLRPDDVPELFRVIDRNTSGVLTVTRTDLTFRMMIKVARPGGGHYRMAAEFDVYSAWKIRQVRALRIAIDMETTLMRAMGFEDYQACVDSRKMHMTNGEFPHCGVLYGRKMTTNIEEATCKSCLNIYKRLKN